MARKRKWIDRKLLKELCLAQLTDEELARCLKVSPDTLTRRYAESIKAWKKQGVASMRRRLFTTAMQDVPILNKEGDVIGTQPKSGATTAMIFFLKNFGDMADVSRTEERPKGVGFGDLPVPRSQSSAIN